MWTITPSPTAPSTRPTNIAPRPTTLILSPTFNIQFPPRDFVICEAKGAKVPSLVQFSDFNKLTVNQESSVSSSVVIDNSFNDLFWVTDFMSDIFSKVLVECCELMSWSVDCKKFSSEARSVSTSKK
ncbi:hypothetical protein [Bacillus phage PK2]|nr:hypothetical protein [Bacillus phage PK2]